MTDIAEAAGPQIATSFLKSIAGWVRRFRGRQRKAGRQNLARIDLREWSDHLRRDIGLPR
jgi:hypothetical protein